MDALQIRKACILGAHKSMSKGNGPGLENAMLVARQYEGEG